MARGSWRRSRQRVFSGGLQDLRPAAGAGEPRAYLRGVPGFVCGASGEDVVRFAGRRSGVDRRRAREEPLVCQACQQKTYAFERARSYGIYDGPLVRAIILLKWERIEPLGAWFAERLAEMVEREGEALAADVVVPVPLHRDRERQRGYNQAGLISKPLARKLGLPHKAVLADADKAAAGQAGTQFGGALGVRSWRFCHTSRQPS